MSRWPVKPEEHKVNHYNFIDIKYPIYSYILGLIWTDGHINKKTNGIVFINTFPDAEYFLKCFEQTGNWNVYINKYKNNWKTRLTINTSNKFLKQYLIDYNFMDKNRGFNKLYKKIPYQNYFLRGLIDGDGNIYCNKKNGIYRLSLCSNYNQNWSCLKQIFNKYKIKYTLEQKKTKNGSYSKIHINGKSRVSKLCDIIYDGYTEDKIGLQRKYDKYQLIKSQCNKWIMSDAQ